MEKIDKALTSLDEARREWLAQQKALQDQIKSLEENNKVLLFENKSLSAQNIQMKSKMELLDSQLLKCSTKMSESNAYATELERYTNSMIETEAKAGLIFYGPLRNILINTYL